MGSEKRKYPRDLLSRPHSPLQLYHYLSQKVQLVGTPTLAVGKSNFFSHCRFYKEHVNSINDTYFHGRK